MGLTLGDVDLDRVATLTAREESEFRSRRTRSRELWQEATEYIPRGVPSSFQDTPPQPVFIERRPGQPRLGRRRQRVRRLPQRLRRDGRRPRSPAIVAAVEAQMHRGSHFAQPVAEDMLIVARELASPLPASRSGVSPTAAPKSTLDAIRLARGFTGRERIVKIEASYHGHHDALMVSVEPPVGRDGAGGLPASVPMTRGSRALTSTLTTVVGFNDLPSLERASPATPARSRP